MDEFLATSVSALAVFNQIAPQGAQTTVAGSTASSSPSTDAAPALVVNQAPAAAPPAPAAETENAGTVTLDYVLSFDQDSGATFVTILDDEGEPIRRIPPDLGAAFFTGAETAFQQLATL